MDHPQGHYPQGHHSLIVAFDSHVMDPSSQVERYLADEGAHSVRRVQTLSGQSHGSFLVDKDARDAVLATVRDAQSWARGGASARRGVRAAANANLRKLLWWRRPVSRAAAAATAAPRGHRLKAAKAAVGWPFVTVGRWWRPTPSDVSLVSVYDWAADARAANEASSSSIGKSSSSPASSPASSRSEELVARGAKL